MFKGDSADTCWKISTIVDGGPRAESCMQRPGSEDPHRCERNFLFFLFFLPSDKNMKITILRKSSEKWAVSSRRFCAVVLKFCVGFFFSKFFLLIVSFRQKKISDHKFSRPNLLFRHFFLPNFFN